MAMQEKPQDEATAIPAAPVSTDIPVEGHHDEEALGMEVHRPKSVHNWREFLGEIGVIVIGVLIALGAQQAVEAWHQRDVAEKSMAAIRAEAAGAAGVFEERRLTQPCVDRKLKQIDKIMFLARPTGRLPDIGEIGRPPARPLQSAAWAEAQANGAALHFPDRERVSLSLTYSVVGGYSANLAAEQEMWSTIALLEHEPGRIDGSLLADISTTLARLHYLSGSNGLYAQQEFDTIRGLGIQPDYSITSGAGQEHDRPRMIAMIHMRSICAPLTVDGKPAV
jgi:hypothetical protein